MGFFFYPQLPTPEFNASIRNSAQVWLPPREIHADGGETSTFIFSEGSRPTEVTGETIDTGFYLAIWTPTSVIAGKNSTGAGGFVKSTRGGDCHGFPWEGRGVPPSSLRGGIVKADGSKQMMRPSLDLINGPAAPGPSFLGEGLPRTFLWRGGSWHYLESSDFPPPLFSLVLHLGMIRRRCWDGAEVLLLPMDKGRVPGASHLDLPAVLIPLMMRRCGRACGPWQG